MELSDDQVFACLSHMEHGHTKKGLPKYYQDMCNFLLQTKEDCRLIGEVKKKVCALFNSHYSFVLRELKKRKRGEDFCAKDRNIEVKWVYCGKLIDDYFVNNMNSFDKRHINFLFDQTKYNRRSAVRL